MDPRGEQRFAGINIANPHHQFVIHQPWLDCGFFLCALRQQVFRVEFLTERFWAKMRQNAVPFQHGSPEPGAKTPWIGVTQHFAVTHQINVVVFFRR